MKLRLLFSVFSLLLLVGVKAQITSIGLIGPATPGGWDADTNMVQDAGNPDLWSMDIELLDGDAKFRADDAWTLNWGNTDFPLGVGTQDGPNIPARAGFHHITFNSATGEYYFSVSSDIGIIGSASLFGWDADVNMYQDALDTNVYTLSLPLGAGEVKFRQFDAWAVNWGASDFPTGTGVQDGPNIPITIGGTYNVTFNKSTGEYSFVLTSFTSVGIVGDATPGGSSPTPMTSAAGVGNWTTTIELLDGGLNFVGDTTVASWGGTDFPDGIATLGGPAIPVTAGRYVINFNSNTLAYSFEALEYYSSVSIIGDATPGGWDADTDMELNPLGDSTDWKLRIVLTDGELKFRANHDWAVNWGSGDFPTGTALRDGPNIPVTAGEYNIYFSSFTGQYAFVLLQVFSTVGVVGTASPSGSWDIDTPMNQDPNDENNWILPIANFTDGPAKFRAEGAWTFNWGADAFPTGLGTQDGPNIPVVAGTYGVTINTNTGEYAFGDPIVSTTDILNASSIKAFPNPANEVLNLDLSAIDMTGDVTLKIYDINGKVLQSEVQQGADHMKVGVATLPAGIYTINISNGRYIIGKKFSIMR
ncbi:MAG TPA: SusF/SusE family outer membrane protein [Saprospiraceae bacterium]|nr:SusF/SusE family outer membrane protein [Saprospiraceae bacterium]